MTLPTRLTLVALACCMPDLLAQRLQPSQDWASLSGCAPQADIRVSLIKGGSVRGSFRNVSADLLVMTTAREQRTLARQDIKRVQLKRSGHRGRHVLIGLAVGAGSGLIMAVALPGAKQCNGTSICIGPDLTGVVHDVKMAITPVGAVIGAIVGAALPSGGWTDLYRVP